MGEPTGSLPRLRCRWSRSAERRITPGGAANVAANVTAAGGTCTLVGVVGADSPGSELRGGVAAAPGAGSDLADPDDRPTTTKTRVVARGQQVVRIDEERDADVSAEDRAQLAAAAADAARAKSQVLVFQDYDKGVCATPLIRLADRGGEGNAGSR